LAWEPPSFIEIIENEKDPLNYNKELKIIQNKGDRKTKVHCNTNRLCEVEDAVVDWININVIDQPKIQVSITNFIPAEKYSYFKILSTQFNELDLHYSKVVLKTVKAGTI
jgi:hypothetical protein